MALNPKTLSTLEFDKVLARLAQHTAFSAGRALALALRPSSDYTEVVRRQRITAEARRLLEMQPNLSLGGAHDVGPRPRRRPWPASSSPASCWTFKPPSA
jgi:DNA mismatch repair protein MutS2